MKVEYINSFIEASTNILNEMTGLTPQLGKLFIKEEPYKSESVLVLIGLTGKITGNVVITFNEQIACNIASIMMGGLPVDELDDIAKSAIGELCNMILGNTATLFSQKGMNVDITPPTVLTGENMQLRVHKSVVVCIPLQFESGTKIEIDISYKDN